MSPQLKAKIAILLMALLSLAALGLAGYLSINSQEVIAGCSETGADCDAVLSSTWSRLFGLPVAWLGIGCYATLLIGSLLVVAKLSVGWKLVEFASPLAFVSAVWFLAVQAIILQSFCLYCLGIHICGIVSFILYWVARTNSQSEEDASNLLVGVMASSSAEVEETSTQVPPPPLGIASLLAYLGCAVMIVSQIVYEEPTTKVINAAEISNDLDFDIVQSTLFEPEIGDSEKIDAELEEKSTRKKYKRNGVRAVSFLLGKLNLDTYRYPLIGDPEAEFVIAEIMDYTCPHCREFHVMLHQAVEEYQGKLAVIVIPYAGELLCNPYIKASRPQSRGSCRLAKLGLSVALVEPEAFEEFHEIIMEGKRPPSYISALSQAQQLINKDQLGLTLSTQEELLQAMLESHIKLFASLQKKTNLRLPMLLMGDTIFSGKPTSQDNLYSILKDNIGLEPPEVTLPF